MTDVAIGASIVSTGEQVGCAKRAACWAHSNQKRGGLPPPAFKFSILLGMKKVFFLLFWISFQVAPCRVPFLLVIHAVIVLHDSCTPATIGLLLLGVGNVNPALVVIRPLLLRSKEGRCVGWKRVLRVIGPLEANRNPPRATLKTPVSAHNIVGARQKVRITLIRIARVRVGDRRCHDYCDVYDDGMVVMDRRGQPLQFLLTTFCRLASLPPSSQQGLIEGERASE
jgi:hypothetical protein